MNKTTKTLLMAAGLILLAGCSTEVMGERRFKGDLPKDDLEQGQQVVQRPMDPVQRPVEPVQPAPAPVSPRFKPMQGEFAGDGIEDETPRRKKAAPQRSKKVAKGGVYVVKPGDTLGRIARRYGVTVNALRSANNRTAAQDRFLRPGSKLVIPGGSCAKAAPKGKAAPRTGKKITGKLNADGTYTIVKGDNIPKIARKFGIRAKALQAANNLSDEATTRLQIGQKLVIPTGPDARYTRKKNVVKKAASKKVQPQQKEVKPAADDSIVVPPAPAPAPAPAPVPVDSVVPAPAPAPAPVADGETANVLPPADTVSVESATQFVSVAGYKDLADFAAKHNTTIEVLCKLNPRLNPSEPLAPNDMLYVPKK